jgi:hypothetical protein
LNLSLLVKPIGLIKKRNKSEGHWLLGGGHGCSFPSLSQHAHTYAQAAPSEMSQVLSKGVDPCWGTEPLQDEADRLDVQASFPFPEHLALLLRNGLCLEGDCIWGGLRWDLRRICPDFSL